MNFDFETELAKLSREELERLAKSMMTSGVALSFHGKRSALQIAKKVRPRQTRREPKLHVGSPEAQSKNMLIEGENLQAMVTLYKYRGQVDLIVTDPPYNTGQYFRYNDRWDNDPNDPELGTIVSSEDGSRHTKWIKAMMPRLQIMKAMLKPSGVLAICIDDNELFHLGMMLDEVFGEKNRLGIINWEKTTSKNQAGSISVTTEYVLIYAKDKDLTKTGELDRSEKSNARFRNTDDDELGEWKQGDLTGKGYSASSDYAIQSPFTGEFHYPGIRHWANNRNQMKTWLQAWGTEYESVEIGDGRGKALALKGWSSSKTATQKKRVIEAASKQARERLKAGNWPLLYWGVDGLQKPVRKNHKQLVKKGAVPTTFWMEDGEPPLKLDAVSWAKSLSGRSRDGIEELDSVVGRGHGFDTVKPLKLIKKVIQIWCPPKGLVLDPYAGSGTTGHAVLELNHENDEDRRFILVEQGSPENGDKYARTLTWQRLHNAITGQRPDGKKSEALGGGFEYRLLTKTIDAKTVLSMQRDELIDVVLTSHWENHKRSAPSLKRVDEENYQYLIGQDQNGEGYFLIWDNGGPVGSLSLETYKKVSQEAKRASIEPPFHVYARYEMFQSPNVRFWKIPDKILADLGLNENDEYNNEEEST